MEFKDYFSTQAKEYSKYRPKYPDELFSYLSTLAASHETAWDCATGSGQAAIGLEPYFNKIIATDASSSQIEHDELHPKIEYRIATAENSGLESDSADLITVATAIHWLNTDKFYPEAKRIAKNGAVLAVWTYTENTISDEIDGISRKLSEVILGKYWPAENKKAWDFKNKVTLPFENLVVPEFDFTVEWDLNEYLRFLYTWSAVQNYIKENGRSPIDIVYGEYRKAWEDENNKRSVKMKVWLKASRIIK
jgi:ubiquinone/menaquinone biosynthesis C-methylase UbiE